MDEDRLSPELGRLIDAAKEAAKAAAAEGAAAASARGEGWALLAADGRVYAGSDVAAALAAARAAAARAADGPAAAGPGAAVADPSAGAPELLAAAFAVAGDSGETLLPQGDWRRAPSRLDPELPMVVKYLGRWVVVTLAEIPSA